TWAGLLVGMLLKYGTGTTGLGVWLFGRLHGAAFLVYVVVAFIAGARLRWPMWALLLAVLAAIPPLATLPLEYWYRRRGLLAVGRAARACPGRQRGRPRPLSWSTPSATATLDGWFARGRVVGKAMWPSSGRPFFHPG